MNKNMIESIIGLLLGKITERPVVVNFSHLGKGIDYTYAVQKSIYEFDEAEGPLGPIYLTFSNQVLQNTDFIVNALNEIMGRLE